MIKYISAICLFFMIFLFLHILIKIIRMNKKSRLKYIKSFKKGKFAIIYIAAFPLFLMANLYSNTEIWQSIFMSIKGSIELIVLKYDFKTIMPLYNDCIVFKIAIIIAYFLSFLNAIMFTFAIFGQSIATFFRKRKLFKNGKNILIAVGYNNINSSIIKNFSGNTAIIDKLDDKTYDKLFSEGITPFNIEKLNLFDFISENFSNIETRRILFIINANDEELNINYGIQLSNFINKNTEKNINKINHGINGYIFSSSKSESVASTLENKSGGKIRFINKYKLIARLFAETYPITKFMTKNEIDYTTGLINNDININISFIGFGNTNQEILKTIISNNSLLTNCNGQIKDKEINYYIFDKKSIITDKNYNFSFRYFNEKPTYNPNDYLPLPEITDKIHFETIDIDNQEFYLKLSSLNKKNNFNYYIISLGDCMINLDIAEKLSVLTENSKRVHIFTKIKNEQLLEEIKKDNHYTNIHILDDNIFSECDTNFLIRESSEKMAIKRHTAYANLVADNEENDFLANKLWFENFDNFQRESNIYTCLNIRTKLNLIGFDFTDISSSILDASAEFENIYFSKTNLVMNGTNIDYRNTISPNNSIRQTLAIQEHTRWNKYMFSRGFVPATIQEFKTYTKKQLATNRKHFSLTTFDGLYKYANYIMERDNVDFYTADVIKYDYQTMDNVKKLLSLSNLKIILKEDNNDRT